MVTAFPVTDVVTLVPPVNVNVPEEVMPVPEPLSAAIPTLVTVPPPPGVAHVLSPRKNVLALGDPVALKEAVNIGSTAVPLSAKLTKVEFPMSTVST